MNGSWIIERKTKKDNIALELWIIAPLEHDVWSSKQLKYEVSHTDIERQKLMRNLNEFGFIDSSRFFVPDSEKLYSWWSYRSPDWERSDRGRRLDHMAYSKFSGNTQFFHR
jgi:exodeoxyribonuclease-3